MSQSVRRMARLGSHMGLPGRIYGTSCLTYQGTPKNLGTPTIIKKQGLLNNSKLYKNMNYYDRLTSLLLGEQDRKKPTNDNPLGLSNLKVDLHKMVRHSRTPHGERSAAGAQGNTKWAREKLYPEYGGGKNVVHNIPQTLKQFSRSMQAPSAADARASLGAAGRRSKK